MTAHWLALDAPAVVMISCIRRRDRLIGVRAFTGTGDSGVMLDIIPVVHGGIEASNLTSESIGCIERRSTECFLVAPSSRSSEDSRLESSCPCFAATVRKRGVTSEGYVIESE